MTLKLYNCCVSEGLVFIYLHHKSLLVSSNIGKHVSTELTTDLVTPHWHRQIGDKTDQKNKVYTLVR